MATYEYKLTKQATGTFLVAYEIGANGVKSITGSQPISSVTLPGKATEFDSLITFDPSLATSPGPPPP